MIHGRRLLTFVIFSALFVAGAMVTGSAFVERDRDKVDMGFVLRGQAAQFARTGLQEAINWLRRQPTQPVVAFAPTLSDSSDPRIGLVRDLPIADGVWGRYEVWRPDTNRDANRDANPEHENEAAARRRWRVEDVSQQHGYEIPGTVWRLRCVAHVYRRNDDAARFDQAPNQVLHREAVETEVTRLTLRLPGQAALCARDGAKVKIGSKGRVTGGARAVGIYYGPGSRPIGPDADTPAIADGEVHGVAATAPAATAELYDDRIRSVFGVDESALTHMADEFVTEPSFFPVPLPDNSLHFVDAVELNCTPARPLKGSGILYVKGDLTINPGSASTFRGFVYVAGDLTVNSPADFRGAVIVTGRVTILGSGEWSTLTYDDEVLRGLQDAVGAYRTSSPVRRLRSETNHEN